MKATRSRPKPVKGWRRRLPAPGGTWSQDPTTNPFRSFATVACVPFALSTVGWVGRMSIVVGSVRTGAAAFAVGLALAGPHAVGVAVADTGGTNPNSVSAAQDGPAVWAFRRRPRNRPAGLAAAPTLRHPSRPPRKRQRVGRRGHQRRRPRRIPQPRMGSHRLHSHSLTGPWALRRPRGVLRQSHTYVRIRAAQCRTFQLPLSHQHQTLPAWVCPQKFCRPAA